MTTSRSDRMTGKEIADTVIFAFDYTVQALGNLGHDMKAPGMLDLAQRLATTIAIKALDLRLDLRAELANGLEKKDAEPEGPVGKAEDFVMPSGEYAGQDIVDVPVTYLREVYTPTLKAPLRKAIEREAVRRDDKPLLAVIEAGRQQRKAEAGVTEK